MGQQIRHIASGRYFDPPTEIRQLGGEHITRWCEVQLAEEELEAKRQQDAAFQAGLAKHQQVVEEQSQIEELKALVLQQQALLDDFRENYVQQAPTDAMTAARDLMAASAHASSLRDTARAEMQEIERFRREHAEELQSIKDLLGSRRVIQEDLRKRNRELMQRADQGDYEAIGELEAIAKKPLEVSIEDETL
jgi:hypothetical protein